MTPPLSRTTRIDVGVVDVIVLAPARVAPSAGRSSPTGTPWHILTLRRAAGTRCTGAWELVHGRLESGERPADAARREVLEETGLAVVQLYSIATSPLYLHEIDTLHLAVGFAAIVHTSVGIVLSDEHDRASWRTPAAAIKALAWPREHELVRHAMHLLRSGDAGAVNDVLQIG